MWDKYSTNGLNVLVHGARFNHMVESATYDLNRVFQALADSTRRDIIDRLSGRRMTITEIARPFRISLAAVSKHLKVLERAGLIHRKIQGSTHLVSLNAEALLSADEWLAHYQQFWELQLESLKRTLEKEAP